VAFSGDGARVRQMDEWRRMRVEGVKGINRYTEQVDGRMVYVLSWPRTQADIVNETVAEAEQVLAQNEPKVPLTSDPASEMIAEGGNTNELGE
jgi:hypothetical protein